MENTALIIPPKAVILEDDVSLANAYQRVLESMGYQTTLAHKVSDARLSIRDLSPELILLDIELPDGNGLDLMSELGASTRGRFVVISGDKSQRAAIKSIRNRAVQILIKPVSMDTLRECLRAPDEAVVDESESYEGMIQSIAVNQKSVPGFWIDHGSSTPLRELRIAASLSAERRRGHVLVSGAEGLEKRSIAQAVHYRARRVGKCIVVNCATQPDHSGGTQFFGAVDPVTGEQTHCGYIEQAKGGTLVLESVDHLSSNLQSALMSFLDSGQFRPINSSQSVSAVVAVIGTVGDDVPKRLNSTSARKIRSDFMYRLAQITLAVPSLSQCVGDIEAIAKFLLASSVDPETGPSGFSRKAMEKILQTEWSGNIRQLRSVIEDSLLHHDARQALELVSDQLGETVNATDAAISPYVDTSIWDFERHLILGTLDYHEGDRKAASKTLGVSLKTLYNRLNAYEEPAR